MNTALRRFFFVISFMVVLLVAANSSFGRGFVIGEEDVLQISIWGNPELTVTAPVKPDGTISMYLAGDVKAAGLTPQELKAVLEKDLSKYFKAPSVSVIVTEVNSFKIFVLGPGVASHATLEKPLVFKFKRSVTLTQLLASLGSLENADLDGAYIMRDGKRLDVASFRLMAEGDISQDFQLMPNDTIFIPDNFEKRITVIGSVKQPNVQRYREGLTVLDAIVGAGGFTEDASQNNVTVVRKEGDKVAKIRVHLKDISNNVPLQPGDNIIVKPGVF